jgi:hypothetical protein
VRALHLNLDDALVGQAAFLARAREFNLAELDARDLGAALRLWTRPRALSILRARLRQAMSGSGPWLTFAGSGDFHHVTVPLIARAASSSGRPLTVLHFDNHPDWVKFGRGVHCGSWVARVVRMPQVERLITVGVCSPDVDRPRHTDTQPIHLGRLEIYPYRRRNGADTLDLCGRSWPTIASMGERSFLWHLMSRIPTQDVYITIDKDVLRPADAATNWDQGELSLAGLVALVEGIGAEHRIVGADVLGDWSKPHYSGFIDGWLKRAEAFLDQPRSVAGVPPGINGRVNEILLRLFGQLLP